MALSVKKIAIIGGGPSGLVALNEFLHTSSDGSSTITSFKSVENVLPKSPAFDEIVVFEQNSDIGGVWSHNNETDDKLPESKDFLSPRNIRPALSCPTEEELINHSKENPLIKQSEPVNKDKLWSRSAVYDHLFTNVPNRLMRFSSGFDIEVEGTDEKSNIFYPFVPHVKVLEYLKKYAEINDLKKCIRFNTVVEKVYKKDEKWVVTVVEVDFLTGTQKWYSELFDAVVCSVGRFNVPFIPNIENLDEFKAAHPGIISHTKSYRNSEEFKNKKVLLVGGSISAIDLLQYFLGSSKEVWLSTNSSNVASPEGDDWISQILNDKSLSINKCPRIKKFEGDNVIFEDGSIGEGFDKILFATGYHLTYPFLDIPENKGKGYISISSGRDDQPNYAKTKVDNVYYYTFTVGEPTLAHIGILQNPLFFLVSEVNSAAMAGVWSNSKKLPSIEEQKKWCEDRIKGKKSGFQFFDENSIIPYIKSIYQFTPRNRLDILSILKKDEVLASRKVLKTLFYKYATRELDENDE